MISLRVLSLVVFAATLVAVQGTFGDSSSKADRTELPSGGEGDGNVGDGSDVTLPPSGSALAVPPTPGETALVEARHAPTTSAFASRIFRPPISALA